MFQLFRYKIESNQADLHKLDMRVSSHNTGIFINSNSIDRNTANIATINRKLNEEHDFSNELSNTLNKVGNDVIDNNKAAKTLGYVNLSLAIICALLVAVIIGLAFAKRDLLKKK